MGEFRYFHSVGPLPHLLHRQLALRQLRCLLAPNDLLALAEALPLLLVLTSVVVAWADGQLEAPFLFSQTFFNLPDSTHSQVEVRRAFYNALLYSTIATTLQYFKALNVDVKPLFWEYARLVILRCHL